MNEIKYESGELMENYKPGYLGKVMPVDNQSKMTDFVTNKYDAFTKVYDICKNQSSNINNIVGVDTGGTSTSVELSVKLSTTQETINAIKKNASNDPSISINNDVITVKT